MKKNLPWSQQELAALKKFYPLYQTKITKTDLLKLFPARTWNSITDRARGLGLYIAEGAVDLEFMAQLEKVIKV